MTSFELAQVFTSKWEGGLVDHPSDPGGITNYGISIRFLKDTATLRPEFMASIGLPKNPEDVLPETIKRLTGYQATALLKSEFWDAQKLDCIPQLVAIAHYDFSVNGGVPQAVRILQRTVGAKADGLIGKATIHKITEACGDRGEFTIAVDVCIARQKFYDDLASTKPKFKVFLKGWTNRVNALRGYITNVHTDLHTPKKGN